MKTRNAILLCAIILIAAPLIMAQEFPIGAYIHKPDSAVYRSCNFTWAAMMTDFYSDTNSYYFLNQSNLRIMAMRWSNIYYPSIAQRLVIEAEQNPVSDLSQNFFQLRETGTTDGNARRATPGTHSAGYMVRDPVPYWEYSNNTAYIDSFRIKIAYVPGTHKLVATLSVVDKTTGATLASQVLYNDTHFGDNSYHWFTLSFTTGTASKSGSEEKVQFVKSFESTLATDYNIDVRIYWHGQVETWLDKVIINDSKAHSLYSGAYDSQISGEAQTYTSGLYPLMRRFMLKDEPNLSGFYPFRRVDDVLVAAHPNDPIAGRGRGWTANCLKYQRFLQEGKPHELAVDIYPIGPSIPSPSLTDQEAGDLGIPPYSNNYALYTSRLQNALDSLVSVNQTHYGYTWNKGLRPAIEATKAMGSKKGIWFIPQLHGILWKSNGKYVPSNSYYSGLRNPTPREISAMVLMSLAYGAKGIIYYPYSTTYDPRAGVENWNPGLVRRESSGFESNHSSNYCTFTFDNGTRSVFTGYQEKWGAVQAINANLKQLAPILADTNKVWQNGASIHKGQISNIYAVIEYLYTLNNNNQQDSYPSATYAEAGYLRDLNNWDYLVAVNRRCAPTQGSVDDRRKMNIKLKKGSGYWAVSEIPSGQYWTLNYNGNFTTSLFEPGEGRVYRVAPRDIYVPSQFTTISAALAASMGGQVVKVSAGSYNESGTVTVKTGVTLQLNAGVTINFATGSKLAVYGKLDANGTDTTSNAVTFTCASATPGGWQGIWLYGTETCHELDYTRIKYGNYGVYAVTNVGIDFHNCILERNRYGIYANNATVYVSDSKVRNNSDAGVSIYGNRPCQFGGSRISNPGVDGLQFTSAGPSIFNSLITQNYRGVVGSSSTIDMGISCDYGGYNSIFNNSSYELSISYGIIYAQKNWWGYPGIPSYDFYYGPNGTILAWCYLTEPPPSSYLRGGGDQIAATVMEISLEDSAAFSLLSNGLILRSQGDSPGAMELLKQIPKRYPQSHWSFSALMELCKTHEIALEQGHESIDIAGYLTDLIKVQESEDQEAETLPLSMQLLTSEMIRQGNALAAAEQCKVIINLFPDSRWEEDALYNLFSICLFISDNPVMAEEMLNNLREKYPNSEHLIHAYAALGRDTTGFLKGVEGAEPVFEHVQLNGIPMEYNLSNNFPNPFNPETEIRYSLPDAGFVRMEIFNVLGQKVATLIQGNKVPGNYLIKWKGHSDAGIKLPAGVYVCVMRVNDFVKSIKMTLLP
ncbi:DUF1565 domain-containing protein [candidate division KSB1 bacterium]|nr:DUF1565 domain-containing protein [candidate division KSB1 bacterium]